MKRVTLRVPDTLNQQLKQQAADKGVSLNALIVYMAWDFIKELEQMKILEQNKEKNHEPNKTKTKNE